MTTNKLIKTLFNVNHAKIKDVKIDAENKEIFIYVDIHKAKQHICPYCGKKCKGYDHTTSRRMWRTLDTFIFKTYIVADVHRVFCKEHNVVSEKVPRARHNSRFAYEFENQVAYMGLHLNKKECSTIMRIAWNTVGDVLTRIREDYERNLEGRFDNLEIIGIDETSYQKGHKYITTIVDQVRKRVVYIYEGKSREGLDEFFSKLSAEQKDSIKLVSGDGAKWIAASVKDNLPNADFCIDAFHVVEWAIAAMDEARKEVWRSLKDYKNSKPEKGSHHKSKEVKTKSEQYEKIKKLAKYALGKNPENLTINQRSFLDDTEKMYPKIYRYYLLKEQLRLIFKMTDVEQVKTELKKWYFKASHSKSNSIKELAKKVNSRMEQILNTIKYKISNALIESFNNKIKGLIKKSYGFRNIENMKDLIYISCSDLYSKILPAFMMKNS